VVRADHLSPVDIADVLALAKAASDADGAPPLSEHTVLHIRRGGDAPAVHLLVRTDAGLVGYAHIDPTDAVEGAAAEVVVHPAHRRLGLGRALVREAMAVADERADGRLRLWAHGDHPSAGALALSLGFERTRSLLQMRRQLSTPVPEPVLPAGVRLRTFEPGRDDEEWVRLNARAFAGHPEQGRWTIADLRTRLGEPWFDPAGFLLAERDGRLVGFHWVKIHGGRSGPQDGHGHQPIGEVYILGVDPDAAGSGLGTALTLAGLRYMRDLGLRSAMLYVDESNRPTVALYKRLGFALWSTDVAYRRHELVNHVSA
jgi:mycothiol synthase